jgi:phage/plasmid-like protein (TIGR03299 family)
MAHEIDMSTGRPAIAYRGETPWHQLGFAMPAGADIATWQQEAGLDWEAKTAVVEYERKVIDYDGSAKPLRTTKADSKVIYRSDTGEALSIVSTRYRPVQPKQILEFFRDLTERWGFELETAGSLKGGRRIWALARTDCALQLRGDDRVKGYMLMATTFDGSGSTSCRFTPVRVVCNNTFNLAYGGQASVIVPHSTSFDADKVKQELKIGDAWEAFSAQSRAMSERMVNRDEGVRFFLDVYYGLTDVDQLKEARKDAKVAAAMDKTMERLGDILYNSPGAALSSAKGMLWGLVNAVTYDQDFARPARSQENRLEGAWFGAGATIKQRAWEAANRLLAA